MENFKTKLSPECKQLLMKYTKVPDIADAGKEHGVNYWTLNAIKLGRSNIANKSNYNSIKALISKAIANAKNEVKEAHADITEMEKFLSGEFSE